MQRAGTGRPGRYCSAACRQAAHRERVRQAQAVADHAAALTGARVGAAILGSQIRPAADAAILAVGRVPSCARREGGDLAAALGELRACVGQLERLALDFRRTEDQVTALEAAPPLVP